MCVVLPLLLASALHLFCFIICRGHPEFMDFRRLLFDYEVSSFNVEIMCEIIWLVATISFLFISFLKALSVSQLSSFEGPWPVHTTFSLISKRVNEMNDVDSRSWQREDAFTTRFALLFSFWKDIWPRTPIDEAQGTLTCSRATNAWPGFVFPLFFLFDFEITPYGLDGYPGLVMVFTVWVFAFFLFWFLTASVTYTFGILSSGKPRPWNGLWMTKKSGTRYGYSHFAWEV